MYKRKKTTTAAERIEFLAIIKALADAPDDTEIDVYLTGIFFGAGRRLHPATIYRGAETGRYPAPASPGVWNLGQCRRARAARSVEA